MPKQDNDNNTLAHTQWNCKYHMAEDCDFNKIGVIVKFRNARLNIKYHDFVILCCFCSLIVLFFYWWIAF